MRTPASITDILIGACKYFHNAGYSVHSQTEASVTFQNGKDITWTAVALLFFFTIIIGTVLYLILVKRRQIVLTFMPLDGHFDILAAGNTLKAQETAAAYLKTLPRPK
jgi:uncharacterized membrane protein YagU involved in acid resistance